LDNTVRQKQRNIYQNQKDVKNIADTEEHNSAEDKGKTKCKKRTTGRELRKRETHDF
jgi:hypothetical protein